MNEGNGYVPWGQGAERRRKKPLRRHHRALWQRLKETDRTWVPPLAALVQTHAGALAHFVCHALAKSLEQAPEWFVPQASFWADMVLMARLLVPAHLLPTSFLNEKIKAFQEQSVGFLVDFFRNEDNQIRLVAPAIRHLAAWVEAQPHLFTLMDGLGRYGSLLHEDYRWIGVLAGMFPALSNETVALLPGLRECFFSALADMPQEYRLELELLAEKVLAQLARELLFPQLRQMLGHDPRGHLLFPLLEGIVASVPGRSCINAVLSILCTPRTELSSGRMIAISIRELGGLYVKLTQVLAELCPPSLARELRASQDDTGGLLPSREHSWKYLLRCFEHPDLAPWKAQLLIPKTPQNYFASASVGALYEFHFTPEAQRQWGCATALVKVQRPGLAQLFEEQLGHILKLCDGARDLISQDRTLPRNVRMELLGTLQAVRRAVLNYYHQSTTELDFRKEKENAERVQVALGPGHAVLIPQFFFASEQLTISQRMRGTKVTKIVQTRYLERRAIADTLTQTYLSLVFEHGLVWADPHAGNILCDDQSGRISMIDLNPCFVWDAGTREDFLQLMYRLLLRDARGIYMRLYQLVDDPESLHSSSLVDDLEKFLASPHASGSLVTFVGEFLRTLGEAGVNLRTEVQAALRGLSQVALTATVISARNSFGPLLRRYFGVRELVAAAWQVGFRRALRVLTNLAFDFTRTMGLEDVGPVLDERDLESLSAQVKGLVRAGVCDVKLQRISPDDNPHLALSADGSVLLKTSHLRLSVIEKRRPASVCYEIHIPTREWLRERQEFVKLASIASNFCTIEALEQLRRSSLDDYWRVVEAWNKAAVSRTIEETRLVGEVRTAAARLYSLRFARIWDHPFVGLSFFKKNIWKLVIYIEYLKEKTQQNHLTTLRKKWGNVLLSQFALGTLYRLKMVVVELFLSLLRRSLRSSRYSMHLLPMSSKHLDELILFGLGRNFFEGRFQ